MHLQRPRLAAVTIYAWCLGHQATLQWHPRQTVAISIFEAMLLGELPTCPCVELKRFCPEYDSGLHLLRVYSTARSAYLVGDVVGLIEVGGLQVDGLIEVAMRYHTCIYKEEIIHV